MSATRAIHRFTVDDYEQMIEYGILNENHRVELIRGEIVDKMSIGERHGACVKRLNELFFTLSSKRVTVSIQDPIRLADSEPEPDVALLQHRADYYLKAKPRPNDVLLVIEVADTTLDYDREVKGPMYAEAGIREYWIVNLVDDCLEVHRQPSPSAQFADVRTLLRGQTIDILALPGLVISVDDML